MNCCDVRHRLAEQFAMTARLFAEAAAHMAGLVDSDGEYVQWREKTEAAQRRAETAYIALEEHIDQHRCTSAHKPLHFHAAAD
jgi:hypothetical protein